MKFNVITFLNSHRIPYITKGVNVKKGEININCPFCAKTSSPDPSYHLGIDEERMQFSCWRNKRNHSGRTLHKLLMALAHCSYDEACKLLGQRPIWLQEGVFESLLDLFDEKPTAAKNLLEFPDEIQPLNPDLRRNQRFIEYLCNDRGYNERDIYRVVQRYDLHSAISGMFKDRIVVPNYVRGSLVNWTGRSVYKDVHLRYLSLDSAHGALVSIKECLFNEANIFKGGKILVVNEGPFDAMKVDFYGASLGVRATCLFNKKATTVQLGCFGELANLFDKIVVMFDRGEFVDQQVFMSQISWIGQSDVVVDWDCPAHVKDPGELTCAGVRGMCNSMLNKLLGC